MKLTRNQIVLLLFVLSIITFLFVKGYKTAETSISTTANSNVHSFDFEDYLSEEKAELSETLKVRLAELEKDNKTALGLQKIIVLWDSLNNQFVSGHYMEQYANLEPTEQNWFAAGSKYYAYASLSNDSLMIAESASLAKKDFQKVLALNPNNLEAKTAMAAIIVQIDQDVMKGVGMLKEVVAKDSNNVQAIFTLGMLSIQSGQLDKAEERFQKLIQLQPFNAEYYFYLGEVYAKAGKTEKAIKTYETCKTLLKDKEAQKDIETLIKKLNNI